MTGVFAPLRIPDMRRLWMATSLSLVGDGAYMVGIAWVALHVGHGPQDLALIILAWSLGMFVMLLPAGLMADRRPRRDLLVGADLVRAATLALMGTLTLTSDVGVWPLAALSLVQGGAEAFFAPAFTGMVPHLVAEELVPSANALEQVIRPVAYRFVGPALGAAFVAAFAPGSALLLDAGTFLLSAVLIGRIRAPSLAEPTEAREEVAGAAILQGVRFTVSRRWLLIVMVTWSLALLLVWGPIETILPYIVRDRLGHGAIAFAALMLCGGVGGLLGGLLMSRRGLSARPLVVVPLALGASLLAVGGYGLATSLGPLLVLSAVYGAGMAYAYAVWATLLQLKVPDSVLGRVFALDYVAGLAVAPLSLAVVGPLSSVVDPRVVIGIAGLLAGGLVLTALLSSEVRNMGVPSRSGSEPETGPEAQASTSLGPAAALER